MIFSSLRRWIKSFNPYRPEELKPRDGIAPLEMERSKIKARFATYFLIAFVGFVVWSLYAPIDAGVHVGGTVAVQGNRKAVQHPQGGVVHEILVREGSQVKQGDPLLRINPLSAQAELNTVDLDYIAALAEESRLVAERDSRSVINWLPELGALGGGAKVMEAKALQERIFRSRTEDLNSRQRILQEQIAGLNAQINELGQVLKVRKTQLDLLSEDVKSNSELAQEGYVPRSKANELERSRSDLLASISATASEIGKARTAVAAAQLQIAQDRSVFLRDVDAQLSVVQKTRKSLSLKVESVRFTLSLADLRAPVSGTVVGLKVFTVGGVIRAGDVLMEIVPKEQQLIVQDKVPTNLIDKVQVGLQSDLRFTAFNQTTTPVIPGQVVLVGADRLLKTPEDDPSTPPEYYAAQVETTQQGLLMLGSNVVQPGMPVDVIIKTGERSFMSYLLKPLLDRVAVSFKDN